MNPRKVWLIAAGASVALGVFSMGCESTPAASIGPGGPRVSVRAGTVTLGTTTGTLRKTVDVPAFSIAKTPTTVAEYRQCVAAGACKAPSLSAGACAVGYGLAGATYAPSTDADLRPVTCMTVEQAQQYCAWVGGRLPRFSEWVYAARGPDVAHYAWGNAPADCKRRGAVSSAFGDCCGAACDSQQATAVGQHPAGDSPLGVSDVLLSRGELVGGDGASPYPACQSPGGACVATGVFPGAIDHFLPADQGDALSTLTHQVPAGFRCAWEGDGQ